jgi:hypothetical protein
VIWRNSSTGDIVFYFMNGLTVTGWSIVSQGVPAYTEWVIVR